jgi:hypothetical protein
MSEKKRDQLGILRYELNFIEQGGYSKRIGAPGGSSIFEDSSTCPNHGDPLCRHACHECLLFDFVPEGHRTDDIPCHHIPLNQNELTISTSNESQDELCKAVARWLKRTIATLQRESTNVTRTIADGSASTACQEIRC